MQVRRRTQDATGEGEAQSRTSAGVALGVGGAPALSRPVLGERTTTGPEARPTAAADLVRRSSSGRIPLRMPMTQILSRLASTRSLAARVSLQIQAA